MRQFKLLRIGATSFKSFTTNLCFTLPTEPGFRFLTGENLAEPRLGANGVGKSSLWDTVVWCLYGTSVRGAKASELVSYGKKIPSAEIWFSIDDQPHAIIRTGNPNILLLDNEPATQEQIDSLLGITRLRFLHSVIFGQGVPMFLDLSVPERGRLLDEVLNLDLWQRCSDNAADRVKKLQHEFIKVKTEHARAEGVLQGLPDIKVLEQLFDAWQKEQSARIAKEIAELEKQEEIIAKLNALTIERYAGDKLVDSLRKEVEYMQKAVSASTTDIALITNEIAAIAQQLSFYDPTMWQHCPAECPTCKQPLNSDFIHAETKRLITNLSTMQQERQRKDSAYNACNKELEIAEKKLRDHQRKEEALRIDLQNKKTQREMQVDNAWSKFRLHERAIDNLLNIENPHLKQMEQVTDQFAEAKAKLTELSTRKLEIESQIVVADYWKSGFKSLRLREVQKALAMLELETANAASALGLPGWTIKFATETETKSGTLKQGITISVRSAQASGSWSLWSGGEEQRIKLAVAIGLSSMIQRMAGISFAFEVWDEPTAWLSSEGIDDLLDCLNSRAKTHQKSVWLVDHRALQATSFDEIYCVTKATEGASINRVE